MWIYVFYIFFLTDSTSYGLEQTSMMTNLIEMYESKGYSKLKTELEKNGYGLKDLLECDKFELRDELAKHGVIGISRNQFITAVKATTTWQEQQVQCM